MKNKGFTLIEIMITLVIAASILTLGIATLRGYFPKQYLNSSIEFVENLVHRAQAEAMSKSFWTCIKFPSDKQVELWIDLNRNPSGISTCGDTGDRKVSITYKFKGSVILAPTSNSGCTNNLSTSSVIWVNPSGLPSADYQIVLTNPDLYSQSRAREIEITAGGLVKIARPGDKGLITTLWARWPNVSSGGCE